MRSIPSGQWSSTGSAAESSLFAFQDSIECGTSVVQCDKASYTSKPELAGWAKNRTRWYGQGNELRRLRTVKSVQRIATAWLRKASESGITVLVR